MPRILVLAAVLPLLAAAWEPIACPEAVFDCSEQFATVRVLDDFAAGVGTWQAANGSQNPQTRLELDPAMPHGGNPSLRVDAEFSGDKKLEYISAGARVMAIPESGHGIGLWFRSEGGPVTLRLRISDASGEIHQLDFPRNPAASADGRWSYVAVKLASQSGAWGGDGNRKLDYPCKLLAIVGDRPRQGFAGPATLWFGQVELVREVERQGELKIEVDRKRLGNLYEPGARIALRATGEGARIRWQWQDYFGRTLGEGDGPASGCEAPAEFARDGFYLCTLTLADAAGLTLDRRTFRAAVLPPPAAGARNDFVGFCTHFTRTTAWPSEGIGLLARYGFGHLRDELSWGGVELEKGQLAIPAGPSAYLAEARAHGIAPLVILDYANRFYDNHGFPNSPEAVAGFARYAEFMARELADRVTDWEVWNEWSGGCGMRDRPGEHTPEMYAQLLRATYPAVRRGNPQATVVGIGGEHSKHHLAQIEGMMRGAPEAMDAFSVHSYRYPATPEATDLAGEIQHVAQLAKDCGTTERVWITEIGWPTHVGPRGVDETTQARMFVRSLAQLWGTGKVDRVYWYDFKNDGHQRDYNENNFGVVWHQDYNWAPKPAAVAAAVFARLTAGGTRPRAWQEGEAHGLRLDLPGDWKVLVAWSAGEPVPVRIQGTKTVHDLMGNMLPSATEATLTADPVYLLGREPALVR